MSHEPLGLCSEDTASQNSYYTTVASISLVITAAATSKDYAAAIMLLPTLLAVSVSGWMNGVIFWNRLEAGQKEATISKFQMRHKAALRALKFE